MILLSDKTHKKLESLERYPTITYLPQKAVAEVSKNKEPIGRRCGIQLVRKSVDFRFKGFEN